MPSWNKQTLKMKDNHNWQAKPGHKIFVADRGAVRFDIPEAWVMEFKEDCIRFYDKQPPDDDCSLAVTVFHLPPMDWSGLPIGPMLEDSLNVDNDPPMTRKKKPVALQRGDLEIVWHELNFVDPKEKRDAHSRVCIARRKLVQCLITFDFWVSDAERCVPVWNTVIETLSLAEFISDPTTGR